MIVLHTVIPGQRFLCHTFDL